MDAIRLANEGDAQKCLSIYAPIVRETPISFELIPPSEAEFRQRILTNLLQMPWLVCEIDGEVWGYAYASKHRQRAAYQFKLPVETLGEMRRGFDSWFPGIKTMQ